MSNHYEPQPEDQAVAVRDPGWDRAKNHYQQSGVYARRSVEEAWRCGQELRALRERTPHGQWIHSLQREGIERTMAHRFMQIAEHIEMSQLATFGSVRSALEHVQGLLSIDQESRAPEPTGPTAADYENGGPSAEPTAVATQPTMFDVPDAAEPEIPEAVMDRIDACLEDNAYSDADFAKMRGNRGNVLAGVLSPDKFLERWERTPPEPEPVTPAAPVVVTPIDDAPEPAPAPAPPTERAEVRPAERPLTPLQEAKQENEALRETLAIKDGEILALQERIAEMERNERVLLSEKKGEAGIMQCFQEVSNIRAEMVALRNSLGACKRGREDQRRRAEAYKKQLRNHGIDVRAPETWK